MKLFNSKHTLLIIDVLIVICGAGVLITLFLLITNIYHYDY